MRIGFVLALLLLCVVGVQCSALPLSTALLQWVPVVCAVLARTLLPGKFEKFAGELWEEIQGNYGWLVLTMVSVALLLLVLVNQMVLLKFLNSGDEHSCWFFTQCLLRGKLWAVPHPLAEFFQTTHVGIQDGKWFSVYPPGWPLVWAAATKVYCKNLINPVLTTLSLLFFLAIGKEIFGKATAILGGLFLVASPFFLLTGGAYFSHPTCLVLVAIFIYSCLRWEQTQEVGWGLMAGLALGCGLGTRYLTMAAMAAPFLAWIGLQMVRGRRRWNLGAWLFILSSGLLIGAQSYYNFLVTGSFLDAPNHYLHAHEKLGFIAGYTPWTALQYLQGRLFGLMDWTPPLLVPLFLAGLFFNIKDVRQTVLKSSAVLLMLSYMLYYSWGGNQYGPRYYYEAIPIICLVAAHALVRWGRSGFPGRRNAVLGLLMAMLLTAIPLGAKQFSFYREGTRQRKATYEAVEFRTQKPALVFLSGFLGDTLVLAPDDTVRNDPFFESDVVYAQDLGGDNRRLLPYFPHFNCYTARYDRAAHAPVVEEYRPQ